MDAQSPPLEGTAPSPVAGAPGQPERHHLTDLIAELTAAVAALTQQITDGRTAVQDASARQRQAQSDLAVLKRVGDSFSAVREEARAAAREAQTALDAVQDRIDALPVTERQELDQGIKAIDDGIQAKVDALGTAEQELAARRQEAADAGDVLEQRTAAFESALDALEDVPGSLRRLVSPLGRLTADLKAAEEAGRDRKLYVLSVDLGALRTRIDDLVAEGALDALATTYDTARDQLDEARKDHAGAVRGVAEQERVVAARKKEADRARAARDEALKPLFAAPGAAAPLTPQLH